MKSITVIGTGVGGATLTPEAREAIQGAEVLLGAPALLERFRDGARPAFPCYLPREVAAVVEREDAREFALLVSGDVGFYSAAAGMMETPGAYDVRFLPGVSTVSAFFARLGIPWQDAAFVSMHGRGMNVVDTVRRSRLTFCLTGGNVAEIGAALRKAGLDGVPVWAGENLGAEQERVCEVSAADLTGRAFPPLTVLLLQNDAFDDSAPTGIPEERFMRVPGIPMTKSETRAVALSKLRLRPDSVCWDVGAGTGSVTVEMALAAYRGHVYAVERREDAVSLLEANCAVFHVGNVSAVHGEAPKALEQLPAPDAAFIGGSGGEMGAITAAVLTKNPGARIVVTAVTLETVGAALAALKDAGLEPEITQLNAARNDPSGKLHRMVAQNPITILSAGGGHG